MRKKVIIESYNNLIKDCEESIKLGVEIDKNELLIKEYRAILDSFLNKSFKNNDLNK